MEPAVVPRRAGRVLLLDTGNRVLLFRGVDPRRRSEPYWFTIGGGLDPGETERDAAARELAEETGLRRLPDQLTGPVHREVSEFSFDGRRYRQENAYFVTRLDDGRAGGWTVDTSGFQAVERASVDGHRWWPVDELRTTGERYYPSDLADILTRVLPFVDSGRV
jgi:8-oxo-dGTP pyrophosphatase MutT (NUDIX family)